MYTLVTFATHWGSKHGGINSFNADFLSAFGFAYHLSCRIVCIVAASTPEAEQEAAKAHVTLVPLPYLPEARPFRPEHAQAGLDELKRRDITFDANKTIWLGHDRITGESAIAAAKIAGGRSAVIHHMSYDHYESYAEDSQSAQRKTQVQTELFLQADLVLAVGPLLRDAAKDRLGGVRPVHMLVPGLAEIDAQEAPNTFVAFLSGRLSNDGARIKQSHLGVAAFAQAQRDARNNDGKPVVLIRQPKLLLRGVDFENRSIGLSSDGQIQTEVDLKKFAEEYAQAVVNLQALPYTEDRQQLYSELSRASVALMPSWHEGFGLVAWEALAAGVPLIVSRNSGVYRLLEEEYPGAETGYVHSVEILGTESAPFFRAEDLKETAKALKKIADDPGRARRQASMLRTMLGDRTWPACVEQASNAFNWDLRKGAVSLTVGESPSHLPSPSALALDNEQGPLKMPARRWRAGIGMSDSQLLRAEETLLPFDTARQPDVVSVNAWLDDSQWPQSVRLITGAGGQGKTRLALELCRQRLASGWYAGFLDADTEISRIAALWQSLKNLDRPLLIVVDYAETRQPALLSLLRSSQQSPGNRPLRMLLLARDGGEWWDNLPSRDPQCEALLSGYATTGPFRLPPLYTAERDRHDAYVRALNVFAQTLGASVPDIVPDLVGEHFERPLYIQMAALLALYGERPTTAQGLTKSLLNHERRYWLGLLGPFNWLEPERRAEQLLALCTLAGGFALPKDAEPHWQRATGAVLSSAEFNSLFRVLATIYPGSPGLQALRPDLLGEGLVAQALLRADADALLDAILSNSVAQAVRRQGLTVLARLSSQRLDLQETLVEALSRHFHHCCADVVAVSTETTSRLPLLAELAFARLSPIGKSHVVGMLVPLLHEESVQLAQLSCLVSEYRAEKTREKFEKKHANLDRMSDYARALGNYAVDLYRFGDYQRAVTIGRQQLDLNRRLSAKDPKRFEADYAKSLSIYWACLNDVGQNEEALERAREALEIRKRLAQKNPDRFEPEYATSLSNYAYALCDAGQNEEALQGAREAVEILKRLSQKNPDRFEPDYAMSLSNYANALSDTGQNEEALEGAREAVEIHKRLAQKKPDRFEPDYAISLNNYSNYLCDAGQNEDALERTREALVIRKRLSQKNPDRFEPNYATSLSNYASHLSDAGQSEEALESARAALEIRKRLAQKNSDRFEPDYATSLSNYANDLNDSGQNEEALARGREALEIRRALAQKNSGRFERDYAVSLSNNASYLRDAGRNEEALEGAREAVEIHKKLAQKNPNRFEPAYVKSLSNYANTLSDAGQNEEAMERAREALEILTRLVQKSPHRFTDDLFVNMLSVDFLAWLCGQSAGSDKPNLSKIATFVPPHRVPLLLLFSAFGEACRATGREARAQAFGRVLLNWTELSGAQKVQAECYWLCASAWCHTFGQTVTLDWQASWRLYENQRNGNLPHWMREVARRLEFQWPDRKSSTAVKDLSSSRD